MRLYELNKKGLKRYMLWKEHEEDLLDYGREILKDKLSERGIVIRDIEDFDSAILSIGEKYGTLKESEEF